MSAHTKGPWRVVGEHRTEVLACEDTADAIIVVDTRFFREQTNPNEVADARLIAAAPELLEALERLLAVGSFAINGEVAEAAAQAAMAAIAKAKGEQP